MSESRQSQSGQKPYKLTERLLNWIEVVGNKLPDPAMLFALALVITWVVSALLHGTSFDVPSKEGIKTLQVRSQLSTPALVSFFSELVDTFMGFRPLGVVLVALLGVGVAEASGFINAALKWILSYTPRSLLTPMLIMVAIVSNTAVDAGYVLVIPLGGVIYYAAGRHPLAGIAAAFAGVSGGFSANFIPSAIDPMLQELTQSAAGIIDATREVNPLCNWLFTGSSSLLITGLGWFITDRFIEPRLRNTEVDGDPADMPAMEKMTADERRGLVAGMVSMALSVALLVVLVAPNDSPLRAPNGDLTAFTAPLMQMIVPLIFVVFLIPGVVHGYVSRTFQSHRDIIEGMTKMMSTMAYYVVMSFFSALFIYAFGKSQIGALLAVKVATWLQALELPGAVTLVGIILLCASINLLVGSASAKWALLAPIFVPMLMQLGISPELTQAAYRVGDSTTNIITPLMPFFPLVVAFSQRYVKGTGIGTLVSLMLPFTLVFLVAWTIFLLLFWTLGIPLGIQGVYVYPI